MIIEFRETYKDISFCFSNRKYSTTSTVKFIEVCNESRGSTTTRKAEFVSGTCKRTGRLKRGGIVGRVIDERAHFGKWLECFALHE